MPYDDSRGWFRGEADFPGPKTMAAVGLRSYGAVLKEIGAVERQEK